MISPASILLLGVKKRVMALNRDTGERLWQRDLPGAMLGDSFVTLIADDRRVFAHAKGELFCLDLFTGQVLWQDNLPGLGFGLAMLALPGGLGSSPPPAAQRQRQEQQSAAASTAAAGA